MKRLKIMLWLCGIGFLISFIFMVLPWGLIENLYSIFGEEPIPYSPTSGYLFRVSCGMVGIIGVYFIILARDPLKYRPLLFFSAYGLIAGGLICFIAGLVIGISPLFYIGDGLFGVILGIILAVLTSKIQQE